MKAVELYLDFISMEYGDTETELEEQRKEILNDFYGEHGLLYTTSGNGTKEFQLNINFGKRKLKWYVDDELIQEWDFTEEEFLNYLEDLDYQYLYSYFSDYED